MLILKRRRIKIHESIQQFITFVCEQVLVGLPAPNRIAQTCNIMELRSVPSLCMLDAVTEIKPNECLRKIFIF